MTTDEAKEAVKRNIPNEQWVAAEKLWEMIASGGNGVNDDS